MYKVFVNDRPIICTSSLRKDEVSPILNIKSIIVESIIKQVKTGKLKGVYLYSNNSKKIKQTFVELEVL